MEPTESPGREMKTFYTLPVRCAVPKSFPDIESGR